MPGGSTTGTSALMNGGDGTDGRSSAALAVRMAEMYSRIGRTEETVELVDETLSVFRKGNSGNLQNLVVQSDGRQEIASGFTANDLKALEADELQMIIQLLRLKGNALIKLKGPAGFAMSATLNIDALKIFENCPAADKMKDISLMFPIYNMVGIQLKGGVIDQDDECSLERDLAERFCHEAQLQAYHYARALANLAEMYGRMGVHDEAFKYFDVMKAVYMTQDHPKLLLEGYGEWRF
jgi:tetratricopeptide (TPR) repeat protein